MPERRNFNFEAGELLLIDKPKGLTSFDVVARVRNSTGVRKVGHGGTLDPLATGLLIIGTGRKTSLLGQLQNDEKEYVFEVCFGFTTPSYDAEFPPENERDVSSLSSEAIDLALAGFRGSIEQYPPAFSAVKVGGQSSYKAARKGETLELKPRTVQIDRYDLLAFEPPRRAVFRVACSKGTYVRSLAHDLGQALGTGAYVTELQRTRIGEWSLAEAWPLDEFLDEARRQTGRQRPPAQC